MSKYLLRMHDVARSVKNQHNIDIMVPHGVKIGDKTFPAYNKNMSTASTLPDVNFKIPLENGHVIDIGAFPDGKSYDGLRDIEGVVGSTVTFPDEDGDYHWLSTSHKPAIEQSKKDNLWIPRQGNIDDLVSKIDEWAKQPATGVRKKTPFKWIDNPYVGIREREMVPAEELASHLQKHKENRKIVLQNDPIMHPHLISVSNIDGKNRFWHYNILTEEFKNIQGGD